MSYAVRFLLGALVLALMATSCRVDVEEAGFEVADVVCSPTLPPTLHPATERNGPAIVPSWSEAGSLNVRLNFWVYFVDGSANSDLFRIHAWTKTVEQLTDIRASGFSAVDSHGLAISPIGDRIAYVIKERPGERILYVADLELTEPVRLAQIPVGGNIAWSPDGKEIFLDADVEPGDAIDVVAVASGSRHTVIRTTSPENLISLVGIGGGDLLYRDIFREPLDYALVRHDLDSPQRLGVLDVGRMDWAEFSPRHDALYFSDSDDPFDPTRPHGRVVAVDLTQPGLVAETLESPFGYESDLAISPDGCRLAYGGNTNSQPATEIYIDNLDSNGPLWKLDPQGPGVVDNVLWAPASTAIVVGYGRWNQARLHVIAQDGTGFDLETSGIPLAIVPEAH